MTQEDKELLLRDLCARLPYKVKVKDDMGRTYELQIGNSYLIDLFYNNGEYVNPPIKPILRPMSSMTEEEKSELLIHVLGNKENTKYFQVMPDGSIDQSDSSIQELSNFTLHWLNFDGINTSAYIDWLNAHHFDFRGMIEKGLAIEASKEMYKTE